MGKANWVKANPSQGSGDATVNVSSTAIKGMNLNEADWREATLEEKEEYEATEIQIEESEE